MAAADRPGDGLLRQRTYQVTPQAGGVREYQPNDSVGRIHWPTTARRGELMVKEFDLGLTSDLWVLLDLHGAVQVQDGEDGTDELAVICAASIACHFLGARLPVGLVVNAEEFAILPPDQGYVHYGKIMEMLARAKEGSGTSLADAVRNLDQWLSRGATLVVITSSSEGSWVEALGTLTCRDVQPAAVLVDGRSFGGEADPSAVLSALVKLGIQGYLVGKGDDLANALARPVAGGWDRVVWAPDNGSRVPGGGA
jgi:uncharacterized protein (DUF58 family)